MPSRNIANELAHATVNAFAIHQVPIAHGVAALLKVPEVNAALKAADCDYTTSLHACKNIWHTLQVIHFQERYSGVRSAILAAALNSSTSHRAISSLFKVPRQFVARASGFHQDPNEAAVQICVPSTLVRQRHSPALTSFVIRWIHDHTTPSSNLNNVIRIKDHNFWTTHVIHWRTESLESMYYKCKLEAMAKFSVSFSKSYFYKCMPIYVRLRKLQDGLCPMHHTGICMRKEFIKKRTLWYSHCNCSCSFCSPTGCNHGKSALHGNCFTFTCKRCKFSKCSLEWSEAKTVWMRPIQFVRQGGGRNWTNEQYLGTRNQFMATVKKEMKSFAKHDQHVIYHKEQMRHLLDSFSPQEIIIKCDFIQNIAHSRGQETSQSFYNKRQTQFLSFVIWYQVWENNKYKCVHHLLEYLRYDRGISFTKVWFDSDGGKAHFKSRFSFFFASTLPHIYDIIVHWIFAPSNHGKGDCDTHGAVVKRGIKMFILNDMNHVDDEEEAATYINYYVRNSTAFVMDISAFDTEQDCSGVTGSSKFHEFRFAGDSGKVQVRLFPCFCSFCLEEDFAHCLNLHYAGAFENRQMKTKSVRVPKSCYTTASQVVSTPTQQFTVRAITGSRFNEGQLQYRVEWEGYPESTWIDGDRLNCIELIEEYNNL